jgi:hypothetical protein
MDTAFKHKKKLILESTQFSSDVIFSIWYDRSELEKFFFQVDFGFLKEVFGTLRPWMDLSRYIE